MIVIASKPGSLGNLLIVHATFLAFGWKNKIRVYNPSFHRYNRYFEGTRNRASAGFPYQLFYFLARIADRARLHNGLVNAVCIDWQDRVDLDQPEGAAKLHARLSLVQGWQFRGNLTLAECRQDLLDFFRPAPRYLDKIEKFIQANFISGRLNIGIHIRRGDYRQFKNGRYFYELTEYERVMKEISRLFEGRHVQFVITSDERLDSASFRDATLPLLLAPHHQLLDMYILSRCDYIAGPPSTYTMWASWYGEVPLCMLQQAGAGIKIPDFSVQKIF